MRNPTSLQVSSLSWKSNRKIALITLDPEMISMHPLGLISFSAHPVLALALLFLVFLLIHALIPGKTRPSKDCPNLPPGSFGWPIIGETLSLFRTARAGRPESFMRERMKKYDTRVFKTKLFNEPTAVFCDAEGNRFLFANEGKKVTVWWPSSAQKLLGTCIITTGGEEGKRMKKMLAGFFSPDTLSRYTKIMDEVTRDFLKTHWEGKEEVTVYPAAKLYAFETACRLFINIGDPERISRLSRLFSEFLDGVISIPISLPGTRYYRANKAVKDIRGELGEMVEQRKLMGRVSSRIPRDLISFLLENGDEGGRFLSNEEIVNNLLVFLVAGHEPTSSTITSLMKFLGEMPDVYQKVLQEQREIANSRKPGEGLKPEDIHLMKYSASVVSEVIRLVPPVIGAFRVALESFSYGGYTIPKGWKLLWSPTTTNTDPAVFPNEKDFDPTRFYEASPPSTHVPFGGGPRMCLGKNYAQIEILVFLHHVVNRFCWELTVPGERIEFDPLPIPSRRLPVRLKPHRF